MTTRRPKVFVSHTVRDKRDRTLAHGIGDALRARGAEVWIAPESIPAGDEWEEAIVAGVLDQCTHFLVILSAASVASKWVQAEISLARRRAAKADGFRVLPLRVGELKRFQNEKYLRSLQDLRYEESLERQVDVIAEALGVVTTLPALPLGLGPDGDVGFIGRDHAFAAVDGFLASHAKGYFTIIGDPGAGKSSILAELVRRTACVAHFNSRAAGITTATQFAGSLCRQLETRFDVRALPPGGPSGDSERLRQVLKRASEVVTQRGEPALVIAIDALDEVSEAQTDGGNVLFLPQVVPERVYFVMTRRRITIPFISTSPQVPWDINDFPEQNRRDIEAFLRAALRRPRVQSWIDARRAGTEETLAELLARSELNFMYAHYLVQAIDGGEYQDATLNTLPIGLRGYYGDHWTRMGMRESPLPKDKIRIIFALSELSRPATIAEISAFASDAASLIDPVQVAQVLDQWKPFLHREESGGAARYSIYHESFRDFLREQDVVQAAGIRLEDVRDRIAARLLDEVFGPAAPPPGGKP